MNRHIVCLSNPVHPVYCLVLCLHSAETTHKMQAAGRGQNVSTCPCSTARTLHNKAQIGTCGMDSDMYSTAQHSTALPAQHSTAQHRCTAQQCTVQNSPDNVMSGQLSRHQRNIPWPSAAQHDLVCCGTQRNTMYAYMNVWTLIPSTAQPCTERPSKASSQKGSSRVP